MKIFTSLLNWNHSLPTPTRWESLNLSELLVWKLGILFFWCRSLMSIKTDFESPVVWFVFVSIIICILPSECLTINDWQQPEWVEFNWFYYSQAGAGTISCVRFVMVGMVVSQLHKNIPYYYLYQGPPFYTRDTRHYRQQARKHSHRHHFPTHFDGLVNWLGFYDMFELQVRVWSRIIS